MNLTYLTDKQLLNDTRKLAFEVRKATAQLLHHIREIDKRKLFSELGYNSLFTYVVHELGFSEASAIRRIKASRLLAEIPEIEQKIETGELTLSNLSKAADTFQQKDIIDIKFKKDVIATIENTSTRDCEKTLSEIITPSSLPIIPPKKTYPLTLSLSEETYQKFEEVRGLLAHKRFSKEELFFKVFEIVVEQLKKEKFKTESKLPPESSDNRYIPAGLKKAVFERDKKCQKCGSTYGLEVNHITPFALGGKTELKNLNLLCRNCNQRARISSNLHRPYK